MSVVEKFEKKYSEVSLKVQNEIVKAKEGNSKKSIQQMTTIIKELEQMNMVRNVKKFMPSFPRFIIDSWDYTDLLGIDLLDIYELYKKIG